MSQEMPDMAIGGRKSPSLEGIVCVCVRCGRCVWPPMSRDAQVRGPWGKRRGPLALFAAGGYVI